jgi:hypothetical protein
VSRGLGKIEIGMLQAIKNIGRPVSYQDIVENVLQGIGINDFVGWRLAPSRERSLRRALHNLVKHGSLIEINGKRRQRYFLHPNDIAGFAELRDQLNGDWDAGVAVAIAMIRRIRPEHVPASINAQAIARHILRIGADAIELDILKGRLGKNDENETPMLQAAE